jgi:hypothetical protein
LESIMRLVELLLVGAALLGMTAAWHWASHHNACLGDCKPLTRPE